MLQAHYRKTSHMHKALDKEHATFVWKGIITRYVGYYSGTEPLIQTNVFPVASNKVQ